MSYIPYMVSHTLQEPVQISAPVLYLNQYICQAEDIYKMPLHLSTLLILPYRKNAGPDQTASGPGLLPWNIFYQTNVYAARPISCVMSGTCFLRAWPLWPGCPPGLRPVFSRLSAIFFLPALWRDDGREEFSKSLFTCAVSFLFFPRSNSALSACW